MPHSKRTHWRVGAFLGVLILSFAFTTWAAPKHVRVTWMEDPSTSVGIAWSTFSGAAEAEVRYGTSPGSYPSTATGKVASISTTLGSVSEVVLTGLTPNTTYYYQVGGAQGGFSQELSLRTAPPGHPLCGKLTFANMGDTRSDGILSNKGVSDTWPKIAQQALLGQPRFFLLGGDLVEDGADEKQWDNYFKATDATFVQVPIMTALGNHESGPGQGEGAYYNRLFNLPRAATSLGGSGTEDYYYFTYANAIFVSLSTSTYDGGAIKFKDQADWLDKALTQNPKRWRVVMLHHPIYTAPIFGVLGHKPDEKDQNAALVPVFNKHHVDVVLQSHNHFYERFAPSNCADGGSDQPCPVADPSQGTVYITSGGAGAPVMPFAGFTTPARPVAVGVLNYMLLEIEHHKLNIKAYNLSGQMIDSLTIAKAPPSPDPCAAAGDAGLPPDGGVTDGPGPATDWAGPSDLAPTADRGAAADSVVGQLDTRPPPDGLGEDGCSCTMGRTPHRGPAALLLAALLLGAVALRPRRRRR